MVTKEQVLEKLKAVKDPELGMNIVALGLVYDTVINAGRVKLTMTLTSPMCPLGDTIINDVRNALKDLPGVTDAEVQITFDPPWDPQKMSEEAKSELGIL